MAPRENLVLNPPGTYNEMELGLVGVKNRGEELARCVFSFFLGATMAVAGCRPPGEAGMDPVNTPKHPSDISDPSRKPARLTESDYTEERKRMVALLSSNATEAPITDQRV